MPRYAEMQMKSTMFLVCYNFCTLEVLLLNTTNYVNNSPDLTEGKPTDFKREYTGLKITFNFQKNKQILRKFVCFCVCNMYSVCVGPTFKQKTFQSLHDYFRIYMCLKWKFL